MKQVFTFLALFIGIITVNAQYIYNDFDDNQNEVVMGWPNGATTVANPDASGINTSANVGEWVRSGEQWAHMYMELNGAIDITTGTTFELKGHFPIACQTLLKLESADGAFVEVSVDVTTTGEWVQLSYDFAGAESGIYNKVVIFFDFAVSADNTFYIDDIQGPAFNDAPPPTQIDLPINFDDENLNYGLIDFGGNASSIIVDPENTDNKVAQSIKTDAAELWAGTTVGGNAGFANPIPFVEGQTSMTVSVWSPEAGIPVRLKVEDAGDPTMSVETEAMTTVAEAWEVLTFDFSNEATGTAAINFDYNYNKISIFFNFGITGAEAGEQTYYWDNVEFLEDGVSISEFSIEEFTVYPNPATSYINLPTGSNDIKIYSISGTMVSESRSSDLSVDVSELSKGAYFIYSQNNDGKVYHSKFIKQ